MPCDTSTQRVGSDPKVESYRDLIAWHKAMDLVCLTYQNTAQLPTEERFGLTTQMRRSAISIPANVAEDWGRHTTRDYIHFLHIARGSACELSTEAQLCARLGYPGDWSKILTDSEEIGRILNGLIGSLRKRDDSKHS